MEYGLHTFNAWIIGHDIYSAESRGYGLYGGVLYGRFYSERQGVHSRSSAERCDEIHVLATEGLRTVP